MMPAGIGVAGRRRDRDKSDNSSHPQPPTMDQHLYRAPWNVLKARMRAEQGSKMPENQPAPDKNSLPIRQIKQPGKGLRLAAACSRGRFQEPAFLPRPNIRRDRR
jgi:hypothetical protein